MWWVDVVRRADGTLSTGVATRPLARLHAHNADDRRGARSVRGRRPVALHAACRCADHGAATRPRRGGGDDRGRAGRIGVPLKALLDDGELIAPFLTEEDWGGVARALRAGARLTLPCCGARARAAAGVSSTTARPARHRAGRRDPRPPPGQGDDRPRLSGRRVPGDHRGARAGRAVGRGCAGRAARGRSPARLRGPVERPGARRDARAGGLRRRRRRAAAGSSAARRRRYPAPCPCSAWRSTPPTARSSPRPSSSPPPPHPGAARPPGRSARSWPRSWHAGSASAPTSRRGRARPGAWCSSPHPCRRCGRAALLWYVEGWTVRARSGCGVALERRPPRRRSVVAELAEALAPATRAVVAAFVAGAGRRLPVADASAGGAPGRRDARLRLPHCAAPIGAGARWRATTPSGARATAGGGRGHPAARPPATCPLPPEPRFALRTARPHWCYPAGEAWCCDRPAARDRRGGRPARGTAP